MKSIQYKIRKKVAEPKHGETDWVIYDIWYDLAYIHIYRVFHKQQ